MSNKILQLILTCFVITTSAYCQQFRMPLEAQASFRLGLAAADQKQWDLAIKHFQEAYKATPKDKRPFPEIVFNLGLAYAKGGDEVLASVWLNTYLAVEPTAANADAVRTEIAKSEISAESKIKTIFKDTLTIGWNNRKTSQRAWSDAALICNYWAETGDIEGATECEARFWPETLSGELAESQRQLDGTKYSVPKDGISKRLWETYADVLQKDGDKAGCEKARKSGNDAKHDCKVMVNEYPDSNPTAWRRLAEIATDEIQESLRDARQADSASYTPRYASLARVMMTWLRRVRLQEKGVIVFIMGKDWSDQ
jgi:tetratricopeptide (TPR) repeat protein